MLGANKQRKTLQKEEIYRKEMKSNLGSGPVNNIPTINLNDVIILCKGLLKGNPNVFGAFSVVNTGVQQSFLKTVGYLSKEKQMVFAAVSNVPIPRGGNIYN